MSSLKKSQFFDYLVLFVILMFGLVSYVSQVNQPIQQLIMIALTGVAYVVWGAWHHLRNGDFYWQVMVEYVLIAALVTVLTWSLLAS